MGAEADELRCVGGGPRLVRRSGRWWFGQVGNLGVVRREGCTVRAVTAGETPGFGDGPGFVIGADGPRREPGIPACECDWPFFVCHLEQGKIAAAAAHFPMAHPCCVWIIWDLLHTAWNDIRVADHATILIGRCPALMCFIRRLYSHQPHREFIHWAGSGDLVISAVVVIVICVVQTMVWDLNSKPFGSSGSLHQKQDLLAGVMQQAMQPMVLVSIPPAH